MMVEIGYVARAHGIAGELRVVCHNLESTALLRAERVMVGSRSYALENVRPVDGAFLVALVGVADRDAAELLKGQTVSVDRDAIELAPGEVLLADLIGCKAFLTDGELMGEVIDVEVGAQDRLIIADGETAWQLPMVPAFVLAIDLVGRTITVDPPEDLPGEPVTKRPTTPYR
jgi:16S rRNA processing protein RimM